jgi:hypothetical protein
MEPKQGLCFAWGITFLREKCQNFFNGFFYKNFIQEIIGSISIIDR